MLQLLIFPDLDYQNQAIIKYKNHTNVDAEIYKINWEWSDNYKQKKWREFCEKNPVVNSKFMDLPEPYDTMLKNFSFLITPKYRTEIIRCFAEATKEWTLHRSFDTVIKEMCLRPSITFVNTGFKLIADCLYDTEKNNFDTSLIKSIVPNMLLYKFWSMQTGNGNVSVYSDIDNIGDYGNEEVTKFILAINKYESTNL